LYVVGFFVTYRLFFVDFLGNEPRYYEDDWTDDYKVAVWAGMFMALVWPFSLAITALIWLVDKTVLRPTKHEKIQSKKEELQKLEKEVQRLQKEHNL
jgi:hypothetical protein